MNAKKTGLKDAYGLKTPDDSRALYADWAGTYDREFAHETGYEFPALVAKAFIKTGGQGPILDVGAGTGLVAAALRRSGVSPIDATDISPEMLEVARKKRLYRHLFTSDITQPMDVPDDTYHGIISAGTFTHGHVGPDALDQLVRITHPGGLLAIAINAEHFQIAGFETKLNDLRGEISGLYLQQVQIYSEGSTGDHAADKGLIALFHKA